MSRIIVKYEKNHHIKYNDADDYDTGAISIRCFQFSDDDIKIFNLLRRREMRDFVAKFWSRRHSVRMINHVCIQMLIHSLGSSEANLYMYSSCRYVSELLEFFADEAIKTEIIKKAFEYV